MCKHILAHLDGVRGEGGGDDAKGWFEREERAAQTVAEKSSDGIAWVYACGWVGGWVCVCVCVEFIGRN